MIRSCSLQVNMEPRKPRMLETSPSWGAELHVHLQSTKVAGFLATLHTATKRRFYLLSRQIRKIIDRRFNGAAALPIPTSLFGGGGGTV